MRKIVVLAVFALGAFALAQAKDRPAYEKGKLTKMESVPCGYSQSSGKGIAGDLIGSDSSKTKTQEVLCEEYTLETKTVVYRIRPKDAKHPVLLPIGGEADFRIHKDELLLRVPESDDKERSYEVLSMTPRSDSDGSKPSLQHPND
ncbi:MAG TPA: hypothetical protein VJN21_04230 [Candidatus Acidoferrales bacterium]|nr:hypothetical protein [Candidatus Acidoferrales bacterium]